MGAPTGSPQLSFEQTVPRGLVHRAALGEVYVADSAQTGDAEFLLAIQIPRAHCGWFDRRVPFHDPLSTAEAARQGVYVVVHRYLGVPEGRAFSMRRLELRVTDLERYRDRGAGPLQAVLALRLVGAATGGATLGSMAFEGEILIDAAPVMTVGGELIFLTAPDYAALRAFQRRRAPVAEVQPPATGPALGAIAVGRLDDRNSVLAQPPADQPAGSAIRYPVLVDQQHPSFFDHGYDHAPGPLLVEAFRQAAIATAHQRGALPSPVAALVACEAQFTDFAELDACLECSAIVEGDRGDGHVAVTVGLWQFGKEISTGRVELGRYPDRAGAG
jgi:hypothetical protein